MKITSGGQSGVDRAALDAAIERSVPYGGWCPRGGWAEDMPTPPGVLATYTLLRETPLADPAQRTEWNIRDSDATMIIIDRAGLAVSNGSELARALGETYGKPLLVIDIDEHDAVEHAAAWLRSQGADITLGIGGPRESEISGIYARAKTFIHAVLNGI